eukprot:Clim_evm21s210 gene=Clim_evmTU21s210
MEWMFSFDPRHADASIFKAALCSRLLISAVMAITANVLGAYDTSACCLEDADHVAPVPAIDALIRSLLMGHVNWDAVFFLHLAKYGWTYEQFLAFFPLYPTLVYVTGNVLYILLQALITYETTLWLSGFLVNMVAFAGAAVFLYKWAITMTNGDMRISHLTALFFCLTPANVHFTALYTEATYCVFAFGGMYFYAIGRMWLAAVMMGIAASGRGNGLILGGFFIYSALRVLQQRGAVAPQRVVVQLVTCGVQFIIVLIPWFMFQYYGYLLYCMGDIDPEWCSWKLPLPYRYVQAKYWDVGFLTYWSFKQTHNFILAAPLVIYSGYAIKTYLGNNAGGVIERTLYLMPMQGGQDDQWGMWGTKHFPYIVYWAFLVAFGAFVMHIEVTTRMVCSAVPSIYLFWATHFADVGPESWQARALVSYCLFWTFLGILLFSTFLPFT